MHPTVKLLAAIPMTTAWVVSAPVWAISIASAVSAFLLVWELLRQHRQSPHATA